MDLDSLVPVLLALLGTGGVVGALVAFLKVRPEAGQIAVDASQGALLVQTGVITTLREENEQLRKRLENLESTVAMLHDIRRRVSNLEYQRDQLLAENSRLRNRVKHLEDRLAALGESP